MPSIYFISECIPELSGTWYIKNGSRIRMYNFSSPKSKWSKASSGRKVWNLRGSYIGVVKLYWSIRIERQCRTYRSSTESETKHEGPPVICLFLYKKAQICVLECIIYSNKIFTLSLSPSKHFRFLTLFLFRSLSFWQLGFLLSLLFRVSCSNLHLWFKSVQTWPPRAATGTSAAIPS